MGVNGGCWCISVRLEWLKLARHSTWGENQHGYYMVTSVGRLLLVGFPLQWSGNEVCALVVGPLHLSAYGIGWYAFHSTHLETQTKESNMFASWRVWKPMRCKEVDVWYPLSWGVHGRPTLSLCEGLECKHTCWDPKYGELCLSRVKPKETLLEACSSINTKIIHFTWV